MRRRTLLGALGALGAGVSGCTSVAAPEADTDKPLEESTVVEYFGDRIDLPQCEIGERAVSSEDETYEIQPSLPYPDPPDLDEGGHIEYVEAFDQALMTNRTVCEAYPDSWILRMIYKVDSRRTIDVFDHMEVIDLQRWAGPDTGMYKATGGMWAADFGLSGVLYVLDETGMARCAGDCYPIADPPSAEGVLELLEDGTLVEIF